jgi:hypothetical protein
VAVAVVAAVVVVVVVVVVVAAAAALGTYCGKRIDRNSGNGPKDENSRRQAEGRHICTCWKRNIRPAWDNMEIFYHLDQAAGRDSCLLENLSK